MALADLLDAFSSSEAVPGGGSAAALAGALGASLLLMAAGLPKTRTGTPEERTGLSDAAMRIRPLRDELLALVDRDSDAYRQVMAAFTLQTVSDDDKATRTRAVDAAMREATAAPLDTMRACRHGLRCAVVVATNSSRNAASDVGVAIELLLAGLRGARMNVEINLATMRDAGYTARIRAEADELERDAGTDAEIARGGLR